MCWAGESDAVVTGTTTLEQDQAARKAAGKPQPTPKDSAAAYKAFDLGQIDEKGNSTNALATPDLTDNLLEEARKRMALNLSTRTSRRNALTNGSLGALPVEYSVLGN